MKDVGQIVVDFENELEMAIRKFKSDHEMQEADHLLAQIFGISYVDKLTGIKTHINDEDKKAYIFVTDIVSDKKAEEVHRKIRELIATKGYPIRETGWHESGDFCWKFRFSHIS